MHYILYYNNYSDSQILDLIEGPPDFDLAAAEKSYQEFMDSQIGPKPKPPRGKYGSDEHNKDCERYHAEHDIYYQKQRQFLETDQPFIKFIEQYGCQKIEYKELDTKCEDF